MIEIFLTIVWMPYLFFRTKKALHMLQQNLYDDDFRYVKWIINNFSKIMLSFDLSQVLLIFFILFVKEGIVSGIRISTRPDAIDDNMLILLKQYGVTSIELGAQSLNDNVLKLNNRGHTANDVINASNLIKKYGFSLGLQMMTGLFGDCDEYAIDTAKKIIELCPNTVRIYPTIVLKSTDLAALYYEKK